MLESIIDIVRRAGELVRSANDVTAATHEKNGPADLVTEYDLAVQRFLRQELLTLLPEADFFGEEGQHDALTSPWTFIVDPIDGTTSAASAISSRFPAMARSADCSSVLSVKAMRMERAPS